MKKLLLTALFFSTLLGMDTAHTMDPEHKLPPLPNMKTYAALAHLKAVETGLQPAVASDERLPENVQNYLARLDTTMQHSPMLNLSDCSYRSIGEVIQTDNVDLFLHTFHHGNKKENLSKLFSEDLIETAAFSGSCNILMKLLDDAPFEDESSGKKRLKTNEKERESDEPRTLATRLLVHLFHDSCCKNRRFMNLKLFPAVVYRLVSTYNADPNTEYGSTTPLMRAIQYGYFPTVATLVSLGADVNKEGKVAAYYRNQTYWTSTPLHEATSSPECIAYLLAHGARIDAQDGFRRTPLHGAAGWETPSSLACLLAQGASVNVRDEDGDTPLHLAARTQFTDTRSVPKVAMLLAHGAEPRLRNNKGQTALDLVEHRNTDDPDIAEIKRLLEEHESAKQPREHEAKRARRS